MNYIVVKLNTYRSFLYRYAAINSAYNCGDTPFDDWNEKKVEENWLKKDWKFEIKCRHDRVTETFFAVKGTYIKFLIFQHRNKLFNLWWQHYCIENKSILRTIVILNRFGAVFYTKNAVKISVWCVCVSTKCVWHLYAVQSVKMNELVTYGTNFEYSNIGRIRNWRKSISTGFAQRNSWRRNKLY